MGGGDWCRIWTVSCGVCLLRYVNKAVHHLVLEFLDTYQSYCKHAKIHYGHDGVIPLYEANGIAKSEDPDHTAS